jgi:hypothetical protein
MKPRSKVVVIRVTAQPLDPNSTAAHEIYREVEERVLKNHEANDGACTIAKMTGTES